jgi:SAM-dependent methyltransferase
MSHETTIEPAVGAYDRMAPYYDQFTAGYAHEAWIAALERQALDLGLCGRRVLDVGCGTGSSTAPLFARGYSVLACDISPEMVRIAREKFPEHADSFQVADMRALPTLGEFDLVLCLDDCINYLLSDTELESALRGIARQLAPEGILAFDVNSLQTYHHGFTSSMIRESAGLFFAWRGRATSAIGPCDQAEATVEVFAERPDGLWERTSTTHLQRHHSRTAIRGALGAAGLSCRRVLGQRPGAVLEADPVEDHHPKLVFFAGRSEGGCEDGVPGVAGASRKTSAAGRLVVTD